MALLTLHTDRLDRLTLNLVNDGYHLVGHWLLQKASKTEKQVATHPTDLRKLRRSGP